MSTKIKNEKVSPEAQIEEVLSKSETLIQKYGNKLLIFITILIVAVAGYFAYNQFVQGPLEQEASEAVFVAQQLFAEGDMEKALKGDGVSLGFEAVANTYGSTSVGNVANHYAGICMLNLGQYNEAITAFSKYDHVDGLAAEIVNAQNYGLIGDAYSQNKDYAKAYEFYTKATKINNNYNTPYYLKKAGVLKLSQGEKAIAKECFEKIKTSYPSSFEARDINKYIGQCID